jgi:hypothetical protein
VELTGKQNLDATEDIEVYTFTQDEVRDMLLRGDFMQASMIAPLYKYFAQI